MCQSSGKRPCQTRYGARAARGRNVGNHPDHIFTFFALAKLGVIWVPVNVNLRGPSLDFLIEQTTPSAIIVDSKFGDRLAPCLSKRTIERIIIRNPVISLKSMNAVDFAEVAQGDAVAPPPTPTLDETRCISFTSGTTGPPKGALLTEHMLRACATGAGMASDVRPGDVFLLWEPIYHNSGAQMCILALMEPVTLVIVPRFSASHFWDQIKRYKVTKIHYLGGH